MHTLCGPHTYTPTVTVTIIMKYVPFPKALAYEVLGHPPTPRPRGPPPASFPSVTRYRQSKKPPSLLLPRRGSSRHSLPTCSPGSVRTLSLRERERERERLYWEAYVDNVCLAQQTWHMHLSLTNLAWTSSLVNARTPLQRRVDLHGIHAFMHACMHAYIHTYTHTYIHTQT